MGARTAVKATSWELAMWREGLAPARDAT